MIGTNYQFAFVVFKTVIECLVTGMLNYKW